MKKLLQICFCFLILSLFVAIGCGDKTTKFKLEKIIYDKYSDNPIEYFTDDEQTVLLFKDIIEPRGDLIILKKNTMIFNGSETKTRNGKFEFLRENDTFVGFEDNYLLVVIFKGTHLYENEINITVSIRNENNEIIFLSLIYIKQ